MVIYHKAVAANMAFCFSEKWQSSAHACRAGGRCAICVLTWAQELRLPAVVEVQLLATRACCISNAQKPLYTIQGVITA